MPKNCGVLLSSARSRFLSGIALFFVLSSILTLSACAPSSQEVAVSSVSEAEQSIAQAYVAVLDAERVGGNVSGLLVRLNDAAGLLSNASTALDAGNFDEASRLAVLSRQVGGGVWDDAERLRVETVDAGVDRFWLLCGVSVVSVVVVVFVSFVGYQYFKRWYFRRLLKMKPKVGQA
jgi:hypothetical protein